MRNTWVLRGLLVNISRPPDSSRAPLFRVRGPHPVFALFQPSELSANLILDLSHSPRTPQHSSCPSTHQIRSGLAAPYQAGPRADDLCLASGEQLPVRRMLGMSAWLVVTAYREASQHTVHDVTRHAVPRNPHYRASRVVDLHVLAALASNHSATGSVAEEGKVSSCLGPMSRTSGCLRRMPQRVQVHALPSSPSCGW